MKAKNTISSFIVDKRAMARYDAEIRLVNESVATLTEVLKDDGRPYDSMSVLSCIFVDGWLQDENEKRLEGITDPVVKGLLREFIPAVPDSFIGKVDGIRRRILGASVEVSDVRTPLRLKSTDFTVKDGDLVVSPDHRVRFEKSITHELTPEEQDAYDIFSKCIPQLKSLKSQGWNVVPMLEGRLGKFDFQDGVPGLDGLAEDVVRFHRNRKV